ncbi:MAG: bifunctional DedA family/phosphatase PAP2 family protein [Patescibacteria group bacterium]|nr:bifunctional DedA family/phosphatase PAP2 family protein [Patescibacteria group bacterium]
MSILDNFLLNLPLPLLDHWGYLILFLSALIEALPVIGGFFPGHIIVIFSGFLVYLGIFRLDAAISVAFAGAVVGDLLSYMIGRRFGQDFIMRYGKYFFLHQERYEKTKKLVQEHAGKALIIGRFSPFIRALAAFIAGSSGVKFSRFFFFTLLGGAAWASSSVLVGYVFGQSFEAAAKYFGRFVLLAIISIILISIVYRFLNKRRHIFARYHIFYLALHGLMIYLFSKMLEDYLDQESTYRFDLWLADHLQAIWRPGLSKIMILISDIFSPEVLFCLAVAAAIYFFLKRKRYAAGLFFLSATGSLISGMICKILVNRPRPVGGLVLETGSSFPSLHAAMAMTFFVLLWLFFLTKIPSGWLRRSLVFVDLILIIAVGFSRIYLKVHWFSDVVAGYALGLFWLTLLILIFRIVAQLVKSRQNKNSP